MSLLYNKKIKSKSRWICESNVSTVLSHAFFFPKGIGD